MNLEPPGKIPPLEVNVQTVLAGTAGRGGAADAAIAENLDRLGFGI